jgi:hypothetical protein
MYGSSDIPSQLPPKEKGRHQAEKWWRFGLTAQQQD